VIPDELIREMTRCRDSWRDDRGERGMCVKYDEIRAGVSNCDDGSAAKNSIPRLERPETESARVRVRACRARGTILKSMSATDVRG